MLIHAFFKKINLLSLFCAAITGFCLVPLCFTVAEEIITLTTYYPAPYGMYKNLYTDGLAVGSAYRNETLSDGELLVSGDIRIGTTTAVPYRKLTVFGGGIYVNNSDEEIDIGGDTTNANIVLRDLGQDSSGGAYIDFSNHPYIEDPQNDVRIWHAWNVTGNTDNVLAFVGKSGFDPTNIRVGIGTASPQSPAPNNQAGNLDANDVYLRSVNRWASVAPNLDCITVEAVSSSVSCPGNYTVTGCGGPALFSGAAGNGCWYYFSTNIQTRCCRITN